MKIVLSVEHVTLAANCAVIYAGQGVKIYAEGATREACEADARRQYRAFGFVGVLEFKNSDPGAEEGAGAS